MPNALISRSVGVYNDGFAEGQRLGQQQLIDATMIYLKRHGRSTEDAKGYFKEVNAILDEYYKAYFPTQDQPIYQERMDGELAEILGEDCLSFRERNPNIREMGFDKPIRENNRHPATKKRRKKR